MMELISNFLISPSYAATSSTTGAVQQAGGGLSFIIMLAVIFIFFYLAFWRPQSKRVKEQQSLLGSLTKGDEVMTEGGLLGKINKMTEQYIALSVANNVDIFIKKTSVVSLLPKGTLKSLE